MTQDFAKVIEIINKAEIFNIESNWASFPLEKIKENVIALKGLSGLYAISHDDYGIIYIGKAKSIYGRLYSHYKATQGSEKAEAWKQFFEKLDRGLTAYYFETNSFNLESQENSRKTLERLLQLKYNPLFERVYIGGHKPVECIDSTLERYVLVKTTVTGYIS